METKITTPKEVQELRNTIEFMDALSQEGFSQIAAITNLVLTSLRAPEAHLRLDDIATAMLVICGKAIDIQNCINGEAEQVGCNFVENAERSRRVALRAEREQEAANV